MKNKCKIEKNCNGGFCNSLIVSQVPPPAKQHNTLAFNLLQHIPTLCGWSVLFCVF